MCSLDVVLQALAFDAVLLTLARLLSEKEDRRWHLGCENLNSEEKEQ